jgi:hypothetical protein
VTGVYEVMIYVYDALETYLIEYILKTFRSVLRL